MPRCQPGERMFVQVVCWARSHARGRDPLGLRGLCWEMLTRSDKCSSVSGTEGSASWGFEGWALLFGERKVSASLARLFPVRAALGWSPSQGPKLKVLPCVAVKGLVATMSFPSSAISTLALGLCFRGLYSPKLS